MKKAVDYHLIREKLQEITRNSNVKNARYCKVISVDESALTCEVSPIDNEEVTYFDVLLAADSSGTCVNFPPVGSVVIVDFLSDNTAFVSMFSEVEKQINGTSNYTDLQMLEELIDAILALKLAHSYGPTLDQGVINRVDFENIKQKIKNRYVK